MAGVASDVLDIDQLGDVVLGDEIDLTPGLPRLLAASTSDAEPGGWPDGSFIMQVQRAEAAW